MRLRSTLPNGIIAADVGVDDSSRWRAGLAEEIVDAWRDDEVRGS